MLVTLQRPRATRPGIRSPQIVAAAAGATSSSTTSASSRSSSEATVTPVSDRSAALDQRPDHRLRDRLGAAARPPASRSGGRRFRARHRSRSTSAIRTGAARGRRPRRTARGPRGCGTGGRGRRPACRSRNRSRAISSGWLGMRSIGRMKSSVIASKCSVSGPRTPRDQRRAVAAEARSGLADRPVRGRAGAAVERMRVLDLRPAATPGRAPPGRSCRENGVSTASGCAAEHSSWISPGSVSSLGARAAAERVGRLEHGDRHAGVGQGEGGSEPVGPAADDDRFHRAVARCTPRIITR